MPLLLETDIAEKTNNMICGRVARIGGTVNQLLTYDRHRISLVEDINLLDDFFGALSVRSARNVGPYVKWLKRYVSQEAMWLLKGNSVPRDRKTVILDVHKAYLQKTLRGAYDSVISSNLIEHSPNPIFLLLNLHYLSRNDGYQFHAIPHFRYTYDAYRTPTTLVHLLEDFERKTDETDTTHNDDYVQSAIEKHGWMREFHRTHPVGHPYIHFHVFDEHNIRELMELMFTDVVVDVLRNVRFSDTVVLFKNELNQGFTERYRSVIEQYSERFLG